MFSYYAQRAMLFFVEHCIVSWRIWSVEARGERSVAKHSVSLPLTVTTSVASLTRVLMACMHTHFVCTFVLNILPVINACQRQMPASDELCLEPDTVV